MLHNGLDRTKRVRNSAREYNSGDSRPLVFRIVSGSRLPERVASRSGVATGNLRGGFGCLMSRVSLSRNFAISLAAVLLGNVIYFVLMPYLPPAARHRSVSLWPDLGLLIDFWICLVMYGLLALLFRPHTERPPTEQRR